MNDVTNRFLEFYRYLVSIKKISSSSEFAKEIGISVSMMNEISKGRSNVGIKAVQNTVIKYSIVSAEWLLTGNGKLNDFRIDKPHKNPDEEWAIESYGIPLIAIDAFAGIGFNTDHSIQLDTIEDRYVVPLFDNKGIDFLITVRGSSMYPKYSSGDVVACKMINEMLFLQWNKIYVINSKSQGVLIKRIRKSEHKDCITCRSDNKEYEDFDVPLQDIQNIALVVGSIRLE